MYNSSRWDTPRRETVSQLNNKPNKLCKILLHTKLCVKLVQKKMSTSTNTSSLPLTGITILDFSRLYPGPLASLILADMGATVIKVEDDARPDLIRSFAPIAADGNSVVYHALNRGKYSLSLPFLHDLKLARTQIFKLLDNNTVTVILEGFKPGVFEHILGVASLNEFFARYPHIIIARINAFGSGNEIPQHFKSIPAQYVLHQHQHMLFNIYIYYTFIQ